MGKSPSKKAKRGSLPSGKPPEKPLFSILEDVIAYSGHSEICGCLDLFSCASHWTIQLPPLYESDVRRLMAGLSAMWRQHAETTRKTQAGDFL